MVFEIVDDSGVDYSFLGCCSSWLGELVKGSESHQFKGCVTVEKPHGLLGSYTADASMFKKVDGSFSIEPLTPSRRYTCIRCGTKSRRGNKTSQRLQHPICTRCKNIKLDKN